MGRLHQENGGRFTSPNTESSLSAGYQTDLTGGALWFSPGYFGVDPTTEYILDPGTYTHVRYRRTQATSYGWWVLFATKSSDTYTVTFGARISVPAGTVGDVLELAFDDAEETIGSATVTGNNTYLAWISSAPGDESGPTSIHYFDNQGGGTGNASYVPTSAAPTVGASYDTTGTGGNTGSGGDPQLVAFNRVPNVTGGVWQLGTKPLQIPSIDASGGSQSDSTVGGLKYRFHTFLTGGNLNVIKGGFMEILIVGGGGGGGCNAGGGGGGGAIIVASGNVSAGTKTVSVGTGGTGGTTTTNTYNDGQGTNGGNSSFDTIIATGGGGGGAYNSLAGLAGANGGGGGGYGGTAGTGTSPTIPSGFTGTVYAGGDGQAGQGSTLTSGGGGGAAGTAGSGHDGDDGIEITFEATSYYYAGGGGAGAWTGSAGGDGGLGGAGGGGSNNAGAGSGSAGRNPGSDGGNASDSDGGNAGANTGSGGGGSTFYGSTGSNGGNGGSGIVIVRYRI